MKLFWGYWVGMAVLILFFCALLAAVVRQKTDSEQCKERGGVYIQGRNGSFCVDAKALR